ncbi:MAG: orotidine-5'-phosphate decarboxylase [Oscillospiraceae bacterium]|jgi:orotidine-5'-phosphate decarboxylase|nr:orotidine-5'-phosphate decarboxylase [Oscillospiraceae bacterium]
MTTSKTPVSIDLLIKKIAEKRNPTVAGLDPALDLIPEFLKKNAYEKHGETLRGAAKAVLKFNKGLIDALYDIVPAVKPQSAFYEALGVEGIKALHRTCEYAKKRGMYVILDGKRGDIGTSASGYAAAYLSGVKAGETECVSFPVDALTVNAYLGSDGVTPFVEACEKHHKSIFVLVKTSNPSSGELQDRLVDGRPVYELMGEMCGEWGKKLFGKYGYSAVGAVVGATYPEQIKTLREMLPNTFFLIPGYGAQGASAADLTAAFDKNGLGGAVNSSRGIIAAYKKEGCDERDYAGAARREAVRMRDDITRRIICR